MNKLPVGDCFFCKETGELTYHDRVAHLQPQVAKVFLCLINNMGEVVTREQLIDAAWHDQLISDESLTRCISIIRKTLKSHRCGLTVETLHKRGYRMTTHETSIPSLRYGYSVAAGLITVVAIALFAAL